MSDSTEQAIDNKIGELRKHLSQTSDSRTVIALQSAINALLWVLTMEQRTQKEQDHLWFDQIRAYAGGEGVQHCSPGCASWLSYRNPCTCGAARR